MVLIKIYILVLSKTLFKEPQEVCNANIGIFCVIIFIPQKNFYSMYFVTEDVYIVNENKVLFLKTKNRWNVKKCAHLLGLVEPVKMVNEIN